MCCVDANGQHSHALLSDDNGNGRQLNEGCGEQEGWAQEQAQGSRGVGVREGFQTVSELVLSELVLQAWLSTGNATSRAVQLSQAGLCRLLAGNKTSRVVQAVGRRCRQGVSRVLSRLQ